MAPFVVTTAQQSKVQQALRETMGHDVDKELDNSLFDKTRMCRFFLKGRCSRGERCTFAHSRTQLQPQPDFYKTQFCMDFIKRGDCRVGRECRFAHTDEELRPFGVAARAAEGRAAATLGGSSDPNAVQQEEVIRQMVALRKEAATLEAQLQILQKTARAFDAPKCEQASGNAKESICISDGFSRQSTAEDKAHGLSRQSSEAQLVERVGACSDSICVSGGFSRQSTAEKTGSLSRQSSEASIASWQEEPLLAQEVKAPPEVQHRYQPFEDQLLCRANIAKASSAHFDGSLSAEAFQLGREMGLPLIVRNTFIDLLEEAEDALASRRAASAPAAARATAAGHASAFRM